MATGGRFSASSYKGSEVYYDFCCTPCSKEDNTIEAIKQCVDCDEYYCGKCFEFHNKFGAMAGHKVLDKDKLTTAKDSKHHDLLPRERCQDHHGERLTTYCADHDVVCCNTCVSVNHRKCDGITYIIEAAKGIKTSRDISKAKTDVTLVLAKLKKKKTDYQIHITVLDDDKRGNLNKLSDLTKVLIKRIKELEKIESKKIQSKYRDMHDTVEAEMKYLDDMISQMEQRHKQLEQCQQIPDSQVLVDVKLTQIDVNEKNQNLMEKEGNLKLTLHYNISKDIEHYLENLNDLGIFSDINKIYKARLHGEYDITTIDDTTSCNVLGSCLLSDQTILLTDWSNYCLKRINSSYKVTDQCQMYDLPWGVTCTGLAEVAVTMNVCCKVQFVSVGESMLLTRSFSTSDRCRGICFSNGEIFVSCGGDSTSKHPKEGQGHVAVYNLTGAHLRSIQIHPSGQPIFSLPYHITASTDGTMIHVAQYPSGVVSLNRNGNILVSFNDQGFKHPFGLCTLDNNHILVRGRDTNNVLQVNRDGRKITELLNEADGITASGSLCYRSMDRKLIVTMNKSNSVKVFHLE